MSIGDSANNDRSPRSGKNSPDEAISEIPADVPVLILAGGEDPVARPDEARAIRCCRSLPAILQTREGNSLHCQQFQDILIA
jgi:hypothetical protein